MLPPHRCVPTIPCIWTDPHSPLSASAHAPTLSPHVLALSGVASDLCHLSGRKTGEEDRKMDSGSGTYRASGT